MCGFLPPRRHGPHTEFLTVPSGRIRLAVVPDLSAATFARFAEATIAPGSTILTDGWHSYRALSASYQHRPTVIGDPTNAAKQLPRVHRAFANLKTWLLGTHHGVGAKHLPHYVDEFVFRFNRRRTHGRVPVPARPHHPAHTHHLPDVVCC
jgi:transposase-like protein